MAGEDDAQDKTEEATPRRRQDARERGQVALSAELVSALTLAGGLGVLVVSGGLIAQSSGALVAGALGGLGAAGRLPLDPGAAAELFQGSARTIGLVLLGVVVPMWLVALLAGYLQVGFRVTPKAVQFDPAKLDPAKGLKRLFSARAAVRTLLAMVKVVAIVLAMGLMAWHELPRVAALAGGELGPQLAGLGQVAFRCAAVSLATIAAVAAFDWGWQRWQHERELRMTKREIRDEARST